MPLKEPLNGNKISSGAVVGIVVSVAFIILYDHVYHLLERLSGPQTKERL